MQETDQLITDNIQPSLSGAVIPYEQVSVSESDTYSPITEPLTPCSLESHVQDLLASCVGELGLGGEEEQELVQIRDEENVGEN